MARRTNELEVSFKSVIDQILRRDGVDVELVGLATDLVAYVNDRVSQIWSHEFWPQTIRTDKRNFYDEFCAGQTYTQGDILWTGSAYYMATAETILAPLDVGYPIWVPVTGEFLKIIPYWQNGPTILHEGKNVIHRVESVSVRSPEYKASPGYITFELNHEGALVSSLAGDEVYLRYQIEPPVFTLSEIQLDKTYKPRIPIGPMAQLADLVFDPVSGHCYADWLQSEGQTAKSLTEDNYAQQILFDLMDIHAPQSQVNQTANYRMN